MLNEALGLPIQEHTDCGPVMLRQAFWEDFAMKKDGVYPKDTWYVHQSYFSFLHYKRNSTNLG